MQANETPIYTLPQCWQSAMCPAFQNCVGCWHRDKNTGKPPVK